MVSLSSTQGVFATLIVVEDFKGKVVLRLSRLSLIKMGVTGLHDSYCVAIVLFIAFIVFL